MKTEPARIIVGSDIQVTVRRSARARRMTLRVARSNGEVVLTLPQGVSLLDGKAFAESREAWLRKNRAAVPQVSRAEAGAFIPVAGRVLRITPAATRLIGIDGGALLVPQNRPIGTVIAAWLKQVARTRLVRACDHYSAKLGIPYKAITLRDTRSRWGSCTHDKRLMFSWRLAMAPPDVLDYVAAHEVAHLRHMDHSAAFWDTTERLMPGHGVHRTWLRDNGAELHAWRFDN